MADEPLKFLRMHAAKLRKSLKMEPGSKTRQEVFDALDTLGSRARAAMRRRLKTSQYGTRFGVIASGNLYDSFDWRKEVIPHQGATHLVFGFGVYDEKKMRPGLRRTASYYYDILDTASNFDAPSEPRIRQWLKDIGEDGDNMPQWKIRAIIRSIMRKQFRGEYKALRLTETLQRSLSIKRMNQFVQAVRKSITFQ